MDDLGRILQSSYFENGRAVQPDSTQAAGVRRAVEGRSVRYGESPFFNMFTGTLTAQNARSLMHEAAHAEQMDSYKANYGLLGPVLMGGRGMWEFLRHGPERYGVPGTLEYEADEWQKRQMRGW